QGPHHSRACTSRPGEIGSAEREPGAAPLTTKDWVGSAGDLRHRDEAPRCCVKAPASGPGNVFSVMTASTSAYVTCPGRALLLPAVARYSLSSSDELFDLRRATPRALRALRLNPARIQSPTRLHGVTRWVWMQWATTSWTRQPWQSDGVSHSASLKVSRSSP